jgi:hypothetical protein
MRRFQGKADTQGNDAAAAKVKQDAARDEISNGILEPTTEK